MSALTGDSESAFLAALRDTGRGACDRWVQARGVDWDDAAAVREAADAWQRLRLLDDPALLQLARGALSGALGRPFDAAEPFPSMLWPGGASDTRGGRRFKGTAGDFVERVLRVRASVVAPKRAGWVVTPTSNTDGHRVNASTTAVHALNYDCDGRGEWFDLLATLAEVGLAHMAYQSGGWSSTCPKWHALIPLDRPSDTSDPNKIEAHKRAYGAARVVFGALAGLSGEGFDPTVETPCVPVFITERRSEADPPRQVIWRPGRALDLAALLAGLPEVPRDAHRGTRADTDAEAEPLSDARLEEIAAALCVPMSRIPSGRRDLYMCLSGALLDRGLTGDDMASIVEQVSLRCSGDPSYTRAEVETKHKQHVHDADTTARKYESSGAVTRIGTLVERWPDVARAIDAVLPNAEWSDSVAEFDLQRARAAHDIAPSSTAPVPPPPPVRGSVLRAAVRKIRDRKQRALDFDNRVRAVILDDALNGRDLVPRRGGKPVKRADGSAYDRASTIEAAVWTIVMNADAVVLSSDALSVFLRPSLTAMLVDGDGINQLLSLVESTFKRAIELRHKNEKQRAAEDEARRARLSRYWRP